MNPEQHTTQSPEHLTVRRTAGEPYLAPEPEQIDWRRLEVASRRFGDRIADGIARATEHKDNIDRETARCIAHTLGRAFGRESALATYGRTGDASYEAMRDEYLQLYEDPESPAWLIEQIDWLGTHLIRAQHPLSKTINFNEPYPLTLDQLLVPTTMTIENLTMTVHIPGKYGRTAIEEFAKEFALLQIEKDTGLQAYLSLPNVNAFSGDIMAGFLNSYIAVFRDEEDALRAVLDLDEREHDIQEYASARHLFYDYLTPDWEALKEEASELVDLVEREDRTYVFYK